MDNFHPVKYRMLQHAMLLLRTDTGETFQVPGCVPGEGREAVSVPHKIHLSL